MLKNVALGAGLVAASSIVSAHPGNGIVALSPTTVLTGDALQNGIWKFEIGKQPRKLVDKFHCHWVTKGLDGRLYAETLHETGGAWKSSIHALKPDGAYDKTVTSTVEAIRGVFLVGRTGAIVHQGRGGAIVTETSGRPSPFRGNGAVAVGLAPLGQVRGMAWGPGESLYVSDGPRILRAGSDGVLRLFARIEGKVVDRLYASQDGRAAAWSLAVGPDGSVTAAVPAHGRVLRFDKDGRQSVIARTEGGWAATGVALSGQTVFLLESKTSGNQNSGPRVRSVSSSGVFRDLGTAGT